MNTNRLCGNRNFAPIACPSNASFHHSQRLPPRLLWIVNQRIPKLTRTQCSVRLISPVSERLRGNHEPCFPKHFEHGRTCQTHEHHVAPPSRYALGNGPGTLAVPHRLVVKGSVRLHVHNPRHATL